MIKNIYIGLHVKYPLYLSDFNDTEFSWQFLIHNQISNFMEICPVRAEFFSANGQTDIMKLIVTFFSFANVPKNLFQKNTQYFPKIQWLFLVCVCVCGGGSSTWFYAACSVECGCGYVLMQCSVQYLKTLGSTSNICNTQNYEISSVSLYFMNSELFFFLHCWSHPVEYLRNKWSSFVSGVG